MYFDIVCIWRFLKNFRDCRVGREDSGKVEQFEIGNRTCGWKHLLHTKIIVNTAAAKVDNQRALSSYISTFVKFFILLS